MLKMESLDAASQQAEIITLRQDIVRLEEANRDLEIMLDMITQHADVLQDELYDQKTRALQERDNLEVILQVTTEQSESVKKNLQQQNEAVIRNNERQLRQFMEAMPVGVIVVDAEGAPYYINQTAQRILGRHVLPEQESMPPLKHLYDPRSADDGSFYPASKEPIHQALLGQSRRVDDIAVWRDTELIPLEITARPVLDEFDKCVFAIAAFQDISERRQTEAQRIEFTRALETKNTALACVHAASTRFVPYEFLSFLGYDSLMDVKLGDQVQSSMTVMFADIRDFTHLSEGMSPAENFNFMNAYLKRMGPIVRKYQGFIDKYIGDAIMALFPNTIEDAIKAAINMHQALAVYNLQREKAGQAEIVIGIGLHYGELMLGTIGEAQRMETTVIADAVNLASRLEGLTKVYGAGILTNHQTLFSMKEPDRYHCRYLDKVRVKGKSEEIDVWEVYEGDPVHMMLMKAETQHQFDKAVAAYHHQQFDYALQQFTEILDYNADDRAAAVYLERCERLSSTRHQV